MFLYLSECHPFLPIFIQKSIHTYKIILFILLSAEHFQQISIRRKKDFQMPLTLCLGVHIQMYLDDVAIWYRIRTKWPGEWVHHSFSVPVNSNTSSHNRNDLMTFHPFMIAFFRSYTPMHDNISMTFFVSNPDLFSRSLVAILYSKHGESKCLIHNSLAVQDFYIIPSCWIWIIISDLECELVTIMIDIFNSLKYSTIKIKWLIHFCM